MLGGGASGHGEVCFCGSGHGDCAPVCCFCCACCGCGHAGACCCCCAGDTCTCVGFCFGGSNSWLQAAGGHNLAGAIGFYGRPGPSFADNSPGPADRVSELKAPILGLMGGADQGIPQEQVDDFEQKLKAAGVEHEIVVYPGAPHSFFDRHYEEHADASADAWKRCLEFVRSH